VKKALSWAEEGREEGREEGKAEGKAEGRLLGRREIFLNLFDHVYKLENDDDLKAEIEARTALIDQISELDILLNMLLMQPPLASFMDYLPELETKITVHDSTSVEPIEAELVGNEPIENELVENDRPPQQDCDVSAEPYSSLNSQSNAQGIEELQTETKPEEVQTSDDFNASDTQ